MDTKEIEQLITDTNNKRKKPISTEMYWWINLSRPFYIGDEYKIVLERIDASNKSAKIKIINIKNSSTAHNTNNSIENLITISSFPEE